jgi:hypothetical protein
MTGHVAKHNFSERRNFAVLQGIDLHTKGDIGLKKKSTPVWHPLVAFSRLWREFNSAGNRGGAQEPQWPSRREGALARTGLAQGQGVRGSGPHCRKRPGLGSTVPRALKPTHSRALFDEGPRDIPREASPSHETVLRDAHLRPEVGFVLHARTLSPTLSLDSSQVLNQDLSVPVRSHR